MNQFYAQLLLGLTLAIVASLSIHVLPLSLLIIGITVVGIIYTLSQMFVITDEIGKIIKKGKNHKSGSVLLILMTVFGNVFFSQLSNPLVNLLAFNLACMWFTRCVFFHRHLLHYLADGLLTFIALLAAYWALSSGFFLSFWCYFFVQAFFVFIPQWLPLGSQKSILKPKDNDFTRAYNSARNALNQLHKTG